MACDRLTPFVGACGGELGWWHVVGTSVRKMKAVYDYNAAYMESKGLTS